MAKLIEKVVFVLLSIFVLILSLCYYYLIDFIAIKTSDYFIISCKTTLRLALLFTSFIIGFNIIFNMYTEMKIS